MFGQSSNRIRTWWAAATEDILGADLPPSVYAEDSIDYFRSHPHRTPLGAGSDRREGSVQARPAHCVAPLRLVFDTPPRLFVG
jgi:hypothetical protein